jgi:hypothetical protein
MFNNLTPDEVDILVRSSDYFKLPKEVVFYSNRENLADCSLENTKHNEGWLFKTKDASFYYDPHRESLKLDVGNGLAFSLPYKVSLDALPSVINYKISITDFEIDRDLWLSQYLQELTPTTRTDLLFTLLKQGFDIDLEGLLSE